jgi:polyisoprenyl-phosphate glycosyltransferase
MQKLMLDRARADGSRVETLSVVVACFNEEEVIEETHRRLTASVASLLDDYQIIYVDDGSSDTTASKLAAIQAGDGHVAVIRLSRNFGHQIAVTAGLEYARGDAVVLIDADLQDPPEVIATMVERWRDGFQVVYGLRESRAGETAFKKLSARLFYRLINRLSEIQIPLDTGDFRLMDRRVVLALRQMKEKHRLLRGMTSWVGFNQTAVPYARAARWAGDSKYPLKKMLLLAVDGIISFSTLPLRLVTFVGISFAFISLIGTAYALVMRLLTSDWVPGWTLIFISLLMIGGLQLICLGIMGEYIGRIYNEAKDRPLFLIRETLGVADDVEILSSSAMHANLPRELRVL